MPRSTVKLGAEVLRVEQVPKVAVGAALEVDEVDLHARAHPFCEDGRVACGHGLARNAYKEVRGGEWIGEECEMGTARETGNVSRDAR